MCVVPEVAQSESAAGLPRPRAPVLHSSCPKVDLHIGLQPPDLPGQATVGL